MPPKRIRAGDPGPLQMREAVERIAVCPHCGYKFDRVSMISKDKGAPIAPQPDDVTVCINCSGWALYNSDLSLRAPTAEDIAEIGAEQISMLNAVSATARKVHDG